MTLVINIGTYTYSHYVLYNAHFRSGRRCAFFIMKIITKKKSVTVHASTAKAFDRQFNEMSEQMTDDAELVWDSAPMTVHFIYEETVKIPETLAEYFELEGMVLHCIDCNHFIKGKDRRCRNKGCEFREGCSDFTRACDKCYEEMFKSEAKAFKRRKKK